MKHLKLLLLTILFISCSDGENLINPITVDEAGKISVEEYNSLNESLENQSSGWNHEYISYTTNHGPLNVLYSDFQTERTDIYHTGYRIVSSSEREVVQLNGEILKEESSLISLFSNRAPSVINLGGTEPHLVYKPYNSNRLRYGIVDIQNKRISTIQLPGARTKTGPIIEGYGGNLYVFWKGENNNSIYQMKSTDGGDTWSSTMAIPGTGTNTIPSTTVFNNRIYLFYKGASSNKIYYKYMTSNGTWSAEFSLSSSESRTPTTPTVRAHNVLLYLLYRGEDNNIYYRTMTASHSWTLQEQVSNHKTASAPDVAFFNPYGSTRMEIVYREYGTRIVGKLWKNM